VTRKRVSRGAEPEQGDPSKGTVFGGSRELFEKTFRSQMDAILILDAARPPRIVDCNPAAEKVFGRPREEMLGRTAQFLHVDRHRLEEFQKRLYPAIERQGYFHLTGFMMKRKGGEVFPTEHTVAPLNDEQGKRAGWVSVVRDISERKRVERALVESEEKYRLLVENANEAIFIIQGGRVEFPNRKALEIARSLGMNLQQKPFTEYIHPLDRQMVMDRHRRRLEGETLPDTYTFRLIGEEHREMWVELGAVCITWEGSPATLNFLRDITGQKEIEARLQQVLKMEALGTLAAGIAHDFNNLLMGIQGRLSLMLMNLESSNGHYRDLKEMESIVKGGSDLTKQLLGFTRGGRYEVKPADINEVIRETSTLFGRTRKGIQIQRRLRRDVWPVEIDRAQVGQMLVNLLVNASEAMPEGGHIYLQSRNVLVSREFVEPHRIPAGRFVKITVRDTGVGMDDATLRRIFEPFFTTKEMGRGTGLGLASAYGIVRNHGGIIIASSKPGAGTTFEIYLPASRKGLLKDRHPAADPVTGGRETILFVDDEPKVLDICERFLKRFGYSVLSARNGSEAIEIFEKQKRNIDMVILDMIMPDMSGREVLNRLKSSDPDVKILISTGYVIEEESPEMPRGHAVNFIQKPYSFKTLAREIRRILQ